MTIHLKAALVFPSQGEPIAYGTVSIESGFVAAVGNTRVGQAIDLGNTAIIPGLVNAHAHLELSAFDRPLGRPGIGMAQWIELLLAHRDRSVAYRDSRVAGIRPDANGGEDSAAETIAAAENGRSSDALLGCWDSVRRGLAESVRWGVTQLADIAARPWPAELTTQWPLDCLVCREIIAPTPERLAGLPTETVAEFGLDVQAATSADAGRPLGGGQRGGRTAALDTAFSNPRDRSAANPCSIEYRRGLSLHAPYTVLPELWSAAAQESQRRQQLLAVHLAESAEEIEFMASGGGPLRALLESRGAWSARLWPGPVGPGQYLRWLEAAHRLLIIHGNYLDAESLDLLRRWRERAAVVYCPRTHRWFRHRRYPLAEMLDRGVALAVGTDSRASSPDLNLWAELQTIAVEFPEVPLPQVLALGTAMGADALGLAAPRGQLAVGAPAFLTFISLPPGAGDPYARLFDPRSRPVGRWLPGGDRLDPWLGSAIQ